MMRDAKGGPLTALIAWYVGWKVRSAFRGVWLRGELPSCEGGLLIYANHSSFWDGFVIHQLAERAKWDGYAVMDEVNLARYPFHCRIGAFGLRRGAGGSALATMRYARTVLRRPNAAVFIFPEGELRSGGGSIGQFERGLEVLARYSQVRLVPLAIRYAFFEHEYPDVVLQLGAPHEPEPIAQSQERLSARLSELQAVRSLDGLQPLIAGRSSVQQWWDAVRGVTREEASR